MDAPYLSGEKHLKVFDPWVFIPSLVLIVRAFSAEFPYSDDDITHWQMARFAFVEPEFWVHIWGRPGFTILHALPALLGFHGSRAFTVFLAIFGSWLLSAAPQNATKLQRRVVFVAGLAQPCFFQLADGALTESVFAFALTLAFFALERGKLAAFCLCLSWTAITRLEGLPLLLLGAFELLRRCRQGDISRRDTVTLLTLTGLFPVVWNLAYVLIHRSTSLIPILSSNRFLEAPSGVYGRGEWWSYAAESPWTHGPLVLVAALYGLRHLKHPAGRFVLIYGAAFYALQTVLWTFGLFRTGGYTRFFASIAPVVALAAGAAFRRLEDVRGLHPETRLQTLAAVFALLSLTWVVVQDVCWHRASDPKYAAIRSAVEASKSELLAAPQLAARSPYVAALLDLNPFDRQRFLPWRESSLLKADPGTIFVFTGHAPNREPHAMDLMRFFAPDGEYPPARYQVVGSEHKNWIHHMKKTRPGFHLLLDASVKNRTGWTVETEPWPYYVFLFVRVAEQVAPVPRGESGG